MRNCPNCGESTLRAWKLAAGMRLRCSNCRVTVGLHWVVSGIYACLFATYIGFLGIFILDTDSPVFTAIIGLLFALTLGMAVAQTSPLEVKQKWWAP